MAGQFDTSMGGGDRLFPTTLWTLVLRAGDADDASRRENLEHLIRLYWKPAFRYIRAMTRKGVEDAKDLTQGFFAHLLEKDAIARLTPDRGSFRGFLKESIRNFVIDQGRRAAVRRPPPGKALFPIDEIRDEGIPEKADPEETFDREWNRGVLFTAIAELKKEVKPDQFEVFRLYCFPTHDEGETERTYQTVGTRMGIPVSTVRKRLASCRETLRKLVRAKILEYVTDEEEAQAELRAILGTVP